MRNLNQTIVEGNLAAKPELKQAANGNPYVSLTLGVNSSYKDKDGNWQKEVSFIDAQAFGKLAETIAAKSDKGSAIRLAGKLSQQKWVDKEGKTQSRLSVTAETAELSPDLNGRTPNQLSQTMIEGNVVAAPEARTLGNGGVVSELAVAVNDDYKGKDGNWVKNVSYIDVQAWGEKRAKYLQEKAGKGQAVRIAGRLRQNRWEDAEGRKHSRLVLVADSIELKARERTAGKEAAPAKKRDADDSYGYGR